MEHTYYYPSTSNELIDPRSFVVGFLPRSPGFIYRPIPQPLLQVFEGPISGGVPLQCHPSMLTLIEHQRSLSLLQFIEDEGLVPSSEDDEKRKDVIEKLKKIVHSWIQDVAKLRGLSENEMEAASATVLPFGSYGLGVHGSESDIDALCVGPRFANITEDFFVVLRDLLQNTAEVSNIHCIKSAKVPLMRFKFEGISVDLPYAQLKLNYVPEDVDLLNPSVLAGIDEISWRSLSGVRVNQCILQLVPNLKNYQSLLRCIKHWAKHRGIYGNLFGFLGGIHLAILVAFVCQRSPNAGFSMLVLSFFHTFARWPWPLPIALQDGWMRILEDFNDKRSWMPIRLPRSHEYCQSNITRSTFSRIDRELIRGHMITKGLLRSDFEWQSLFEPFHYQKEYQRFLKIHLSASKKDDLADWVGWVKSRFRSLILKLEDVQGPCDPNPTEYIKDGELETEPSISFYWGLNPCYHAHIHLAALRNYFLKNITNGYQGIIGNLRLAIVYSSDLPISIKAKDTKEVSPERRPLFLQSPRHLPNHFVGFLRSEEDRLGS